MKSKINSVSVVIPCYNEENNLNRGVLDQVYNHLKKQKYSWQVIIVDDESTDNSLNIVKKFTKTHKGFSVLSIPHGGKPAAVKAGLAKAKNNIVLFTDMDQSTPITEIDKLLPHFKKYDIVIGSRGQQRQGNSLLRKIGAKVFLNTRRILMLPNIIDTQCGFKAFKTNVANLIFPHLAYFQDRSAQSGWTVSAYDVEFLFIAQKIGFTIKEVKVAWQDEDISSTKGDINQRYKKESIQMAKEIYRIKLKDTKGGYGFTKTISTK